MRTILMSLVLISAVGCGGSALSSVKDGLDAATSVFDRIFDEAQKACVALGRPDHCQQVLDRMELIRASYDTAIKSVESPEQAKELAESVLDKLLVERLRLPE